MNVAPVAPIRIVGFDVDGTLTDGAFYYQGSGVWSQRFHVRDGYGIKRLQSAGIITAFVTHSTFESARERALMLGIEEAHFGVDDKLSCWLDILARRGFDLAESAFMGDDLPDIPIMTRAGYSGAAHDAEPPVIAVASYVSPRPAGSGAARDFAESILTRVAQAR